LGITIFFNNTAGIAESGDGEKAGIYFSFLQENNTKAAITNTRRYILLGFEGFNNARSYYFLLARVSTGKNVEELL
jgi:hypothetical protein